MRIDIVVVYVPRYLRGHEIHFVPPVTGIHLAALTPPGHEVRVLHQQVQPVDLDTDADLVALSFFSGFAREAYRLAGELRRRGKRVVAGGPHATFWPREALAHVDSVVLGEAESVWPRLLEDAERGRLEPVYRGEPRPLGGLPTPRYDLLPPRYVVRRVIQATRGCPFSCSFCSVPAVSPGFRVRPVEEVLRDVAYAEFPWPWQRKVAWFWDDNLTAPRPWVKELLRGLAPHRRWWLTQASLDIAKDEELLELMRESGCIGVFLGIESLQAGSLEEARKGHNRVREYAGAIERLHRHGIAVMAGFIAGFDHDTRASIVSMARELDAIGVDVPFLSVLTPFKGTPLWDRLEGEGRLLERGWDVWNGYNVAFRPRNLSPEGLLDAHRTLWRRAFSLGASASRIARAAATLRPGAALLAASMNGFYGLKAVTGNLPADHSRAVLPSPAPAACTIPDTFA